MLELLLDAQLVADAADLALHLDQPLLRLLLLVALRDSFTLYDFLPMTDYPGIRRQVF